MLLECKQKQGPASYQSTMDSSPLRPTFVSQHMLLILSLGAAVDSMLQEQALLRFCADISTPPFWF